MQLENIFDLVVASNPTVDFSTKSNDATVLRAAFCNLARVHFRASTTELGRIVGRDHSSVCHYGRNHQEWLHSWNKYKVAFGDVCTIMAPDIESFRKHDRETLIRTKERLTQMLNSINEAISE